MKNHEVAQILYGISQYLYLTNENVFKIRAYEKAAQTVENLAEDIESYKNFPEKLFSLPGIGKSIGEKILEYLSSGKVQYYEELKSMFPDGLMEIMAVPGMGPKRTKILYEKLGIKDIGMLKEYAQKGVLQTLDGFGDKIVKNILEGIEFKAETEKRILYSEAQFLVEEIASYLREKGVTEIEACGSYRRKKETVGDIDILCCEKKSLDIISHFVKFPKLKKVLSQGETKASILLENGIQVDLRVVGKESYGAALQYFTGSKEHNISLREVALQKGLSVSEYGVFVEKTKKYLCGKKEEEVYSCLGLQYIEPELRENKGEIELARQKKLPRLIDMKDIKGDTHIHSDYSDGTNSIEEIVFYAEKFGYEWIIICDHSRSLKVAGGLEEKDLFRKIEHIRSIKSKVKVFSGTEVDILSDGKLDYSDEVLKEVDFVIGAIHTGFKQTEQQITERIIRAMENKYVHAISHPTGRILLKRNSYQVDITKVIKFAKMYDVLLEINAYPERLDLNDVNVKYAKEQGIKFCIGTDAHNVKHLEYLVFGVNVARRGWLTKEDVINSMTAKELQKFLLRKR